MNALSSYNYQMQVTVVLLSFLLLPLLHDTPLETLSAVIWVVSHGKTHFSLSRFTMQ